MTVPWLLILAACTPETPVDTAVERDLSLVFSLDGDEVVAGEKMGMTLVLSDDLGTVEPDSFTLTSDLEDPLSVSADGLRPTVAGTHRLDVVVRWDGQTWQASAPLSVVPAEASRLSVALGADETEVGEPVVVRVALTDAYGNDLATDGIVLSADRPELSVGTGIVQATTPGWYTLTASWGDLVATDLLRVRPGPPTSVRLDLSPHPPALGETAALLVEVTDRYGNPTDSPWTVAAEPPGASTVTRRHVRFDQEGWHTVTVTVDGTDLSDTVGPFLIDGTGPDLVVTDPPRGFRTDATDVVVQGEVTDTWSAGIDLTVGGVSTLVEADGSFSMPWILDWGMTVIETEAVDDAGNATSDSRAVLSGGWLPVGEEVAGGLEIRLEEGDGGLGELERLAASLVSDADLAAYVPSPVYSAESESCFLGVCVTWYAVALYVEDPRIRWADLDIDPRADGTLALSFVVGEPSMDWRADAVITRVDFSGDGSIEADRIVVDVVVRPVVDGETVDLELVSVQARAEGFDFAMTGWLERVLGWFDVPVDKWVRDYMVDAIEELVVDEVAPFVAEAFQTLELAYPISVGEGTVTVAAVPRGVAVDDRSLALSLGTRVDVEGGVRGAGPSFYWGYAREGWSAGVPVATAVSMDFVNQLFAASWSAGALDRATAWSALGLPDVGGFLPDVADPWLVVTPLQPPILVPDPDGALRLQVGDLRVEIHDGPPGGGERPASLVVRTYVSLDAVAAFRLEDDGSLSVDLSGTETWFDVVIPETGTLATAGTEDVLSAVVALLLPQVADLLSGVETPSLMGMSVATRNVTGEGGIVVLEGRLTPAP